MRNVKVLLPLTLISVCLSMLLTCTPATPDFDSYKAPKFDAAGKIFLPQDTTLIIGEKYPMYVKIKSGDRPFTFKWYRNDSLIVSISSDTFEQTLSKASAGAYRVKVSNSFGGDSSAFYTIKDTALNSAKLLNGGKIKRIGTPAQDSNLTFFAQGRGFPLPEYQWYKKRSSRGSDSLLAGKSDSTLTFTPVRYADNGSYYVVCTNLYGTQTSLVDSIVTIDTIKPSIRLLLPVNNIIVSDSVILVKVVITDKSGIGIVSIKNDTVISVDSLYKSLVKLDKGVNTIVIKAKDKSAASNTDSVVVTLTYDPAGDDNTPPLIELISPPNNSISSDSLVSVKLKIKDKSGISAVTVNKEVVTSTDSLYLRRIILRKGSNVISIVASDNSKNKNTDSTMITLVYDPNTGDNQAPFIELISPVNNSVFEVDSTVTIKLTITDKSGVGLVTINDEAIAATGSDYTKLLTLKAGANKFLVRAIDKSTKMNRDSLLVTFTYSPSFTVKYNGNGNTGGVIPVDTKKYKMGAIVTVLAQGTLVKSGNTFVGWNTKADGTGENYTAGSGTFPMPSANVILYAQWTTVPTFTVTYNGNGFTGGIEPAVANYIAGATVTVALQGTLVKTGNTFVGWNTKADGTGDTYAAGSGTFPMPAVNVILYAKWSVGSFTITFSKNDTGATGNMASQVIASGASATLTLNVFSKSGWSFSGWATTPAGTIAYTDGANYTMGTANVTLYAKWTSNSYTITFDKNDPAATGTMTPQTILCGASANLIAIGFTKTGWSFSGWATTAGGAVVHADGASYIMGPANVTLYAKWSNIPTYAVTYNANGFTGGTVPAVATYPTNTMVTVAEQGTLVKTGNTFSGWNTKADGTGTPRPAGSTFTIGSENVILYAIWISNSYMITYDKNDTGATGSMTNQTIVFGVSANLNANTFTKAGWTFAGWAITTGGAKVYDDGASYTMGAANVTLYAKWTANNFTITFNKNDPLATGIMANQSISSGSTTFLTIAGFSKPGWSFDGWATSPSGAIEYANQASYTMGAANVTLYAKWKAGILMITFDKNDPAANGSMTPQNIASGSTANLTACGFNKTGWNFAGWASSAGGAVEYVNQASYTMGTANVTLYAKWAINTYTLSLTMGGTGGSSVTGAGQVTHGVANLINAIATAGYEFVNWNIVSGTGVTINDPNTASTSVTLTGGNAGLRADFRAVPYTVTYLGNNSTGGSVPAVASYIAGVTVTVAALGDLVRTSYVLDGWNTNAGGTGTNYAAGATFTMPTANVTLYAKWIVRDIDGNIYTTVTIGTQVWMVENLKVTKYRNGTDIYYVTDGSEWSGLTGPGYCWYNNSPGIFRVPYGALYNGYAATQSNIAPAGWHVATDVEWQLLESFCGGSSVAGGKLKEAGTAHWMEPNIATNDYNFSALPGGLRYNGGEYDGMYMYGYYSATSAGNLPVIDREMGNGGQSISSDNKGPNIGISIRCVRDY